MSEISLEKIAAYRVTHYRFSASGRTVIMRIDTPCPDLAVLLEISERTCGAYITAFNPYGVEASAEANSKAQSELEALLQSEGYSVIQGEGADPSGEWPPEPSFLVLGVSEARACEIGRQFGQDAILTFSLRAVPTLQLLR